MQHTYQATIKRRLRMKKIFNIVICYTIAVLGILATLYKVKYEGGFITCFRELTVNGTIISSLLAFIYAIVNHIECVLDKEFEYRLFYYLRLSAVVTEFIILLIVCIGNLPFIPDRPLINRFDMWNMHLIIPVLTILSFVFHDPPIGKLAPRMRWTGVTFIGIYCVFIILCILTGIIPEVQIPYSFLNFCKYPLWYPALVAGVVCGWSYLLSWLFSELNRKAAWLWFKDIVPKA
ncbi:MAG: hypothetical protein RR150_12570 [Clostridia bacterium]